MNRSQCSILFVHIIWNIPIDIPLIFIDSIFLDGYDVSIYKLLSIGSRTIQRTSTVDNFPYYTRFDSSKKGIFDVVYIKLIRAWFEQALNQDNREFYLLSFRNISFLLFRATRRIRYTWNFLIGVNSLGWPTACESPCSNRRKNIEIFSSTQLYREKFLIAMLEPIIEKTYGDNLTLFSK